MKKKNLAIYFFVCLMYTCFIQAKEDVVALTEKGFIQNCTKEYNEKTCDASSIWGQVKHSFHYYQSKIFGIKNEEYHQIRKNLRVYEALAILNKSPLEEVDKKEFCKKVKEITPTKTILDEIGRIDNKEKRRRTPLLAYTRLLKFTENKKICKIVLQDLTICFDFDETLFFHDKQYQYTPRSTAMVAIIKELEQCGVPLSICSVGDQIKKGVDRLQVAKHYFPAFENYIQTDMGDKYRGLATLRGVTKKKYALLVDDREAEVSFVKEMGDTQMAGLWVPMPDPNNFESFADLQTFEEKQSRVLRFLIKK